MAVSLMPSRRGAHGDRMHISNHGYQLLSHLIFTLTLLHFPYCKLRPEYQSILPGAVPSVTQHSWLSMNGRKGVLLSRYTIALLQESLCMYAMQPVPRSTCARYKQGYVLMTSSVYAVVPSLSFSVPHAWNEDFQRACDPRMTESILRWECIPITSLLETASRHLR